MPFIPITSVYTALLIMIIIYPLYHLGSESNTHLKAKSQFQRTTQQLLLNKTLIAIVLMAFAELNGASIYLLHLSGITWWLCIVYKTWQLSSQTAPSTSTQYINITTSFIIVCLCIINLMMSWPFFAFY